MMKDMAPMRPSARPSEVSAPHWEAAARGVLAVQRCASCGALRHYPQPVCAACHSLDLDWAELSGRGSLHSWTVAHHAFHPAFAADSPYVLAIVDLEEGVRALGRLEGVEFSDLAIGLAVAGRYRLGEGSPQLVFTPIEAEGRSR